MDLFKPQVVMHQIGEAGKPDQATLDAIRKQVNQRLDEQILERAKEIGLRETVRRLKKKPS